MTLEWLEVVLLDSSRLEDGLPANNDFNYLLKHSFNDYIELISKHQSFPKLLLEDSECSPLSIGRHISRICTELF